jgi:gliding motility-associated-like protein
MKEIVKALILIFTIYILFVGNDSEIKAGNIIENNVPVNSDYEFSLGKSLNAYEITGVNLISQTDSKKKFFVDMRDTVYFDLSNAVIANGFIDIPVFIIVFDTIHSLDFSLKYNHSSLLYDSIVEHVSYMSGVNSYENPSDSTLRFTSYSFTDYESMIPLVSVRFKLLSSLIINSDLYSLIAYLNGEPVPVKVINATMFLNFADRNPLCVGTHDGNINLSVLGGSPPYSYLWSNSDTTNSIDFLQAGTYYVTVTDQNGYIKTDSIVLTDPSLSFAATNPTCSNLGDGSINLTIIGGAAPYQFNWSNSDTTQNIQYLAEGIYSVTVTDSVGCILTGSQFLLDTLDMVLSNNINSPTCVGFQNGSIEVLVTAGYPPYSFQWSNSSTSNIIDSLASGTYSLTISDQQGCMRTENISVDNPPAIMTLLSTNNLSCSNINDGEVSLFITGGSPPYSYLWSNFQSTQNIDSLTAGTYAVTVTDIKGCSVIDSAVIDNSAEMQINFNKSDVTCYNSHDGAVQLNIQNGMPPFIYTWSNGEATQTINNLSPGTYVVTVSQTNQCQKTDTVKIYGAAEINVLIQKKDPSCPISNDGAVQAFVTGGHAPYTYTWSNTQYSDTISNLGKGTYTLTITDANNCIAFDSVELRPAGENCLEIFSGFSPNGDGINDVWNIGNIEEYPDCTVKIFNQWGESIFISTGYADPWDGRYNGNLLPSAAYYYIIDLNNGQKYTGSVCILK